MVIRDTPSSLTLTSDPSNGFPLGSRGPVTVRLPGSEFVYIESVTVTEGLMQGRAHDILHGKQLN